MNDLRKAIQKLAHGNPPLRAVLVPLLRQATEFPSDKALKDYLHDHPNADKSKHSVKENDDVTKKLDDKALVDGVSKDKEVMDVVSGGMSSALKDTKKFDAAVKAMSGSWADKHIPTFKKLWGKPIDSLRDERGNQTSQGLKDGLMSVGMVTSSIIAAGALCSKLAITIGTLGPVRDIVVGATKGNHTHHVMSNVYHVTTAMSPGAMALTAVTMLASPIVGYLAARAVMNLKRNKGSKKASNDSKFLKWVIDHNNEFTKLSSDGEKFSIKILEVLRDAPEGYIHKLNLMIADAQVEN